MIRKQSLVFAAVAVLVGATGAAAYADDGDPSGASGDAPKSAKAVNDSHIEDSFVSVAPCRALDTKVVDANMSSGEFRSFKVKGGTSFASQGGNAAGCQVPAGAVAISATMTAVSGGSGFISAYAFGTSEPATSFMNKSKYANLAVGGVIPTSGVIGGNNITLHNVGAASRVIIDITGYYIPPLFARIAANGTIEASARVTGTTHTAGSGFYTVTFDRSLSNCGVTLSANAFGGTFASVSGSTVFIGHHSNANAASNTEGPFSIAVQCQ
jgi:hypothetical protein